jgi:hypothetical protein
MELPKLDAPPSFGCPYAGAATNCGIRISCGSQLRKGCLSLAGTLHRNMRVWRRSGITAFGQKTPILIAYRRLEGGANPISLSLSPSLPFGVSCLFLSFFMFSCVKDLALTSTDRHKSVTSLSTTEDQHLCLSIQILADSSSGVS